MCSFDFQINLLTLRSEVKYDRMWHVKSLSGMLTIYTTLFLVSKAFSEFFDQWLIMVTSKTLVDVSQIWTVNPTLHAHPYKVLSEFVRNLLSCCVYRQNDDTSANTSKNMTSLAEVTTRWFMWRIQNGKNKKGKFENKSEPRNILSPLTDNFTTITSLSAALYRHW